jgi:hypothetical protein
VLAKDNVDVLKAHITHYPPHNVHAFALVPTDNEGLYIQGVDNAI